MLSPTKVLRAGPAPLTLVLGLLRTSSHAIRRCFNMLLGLRTVIYKAPDLAGAKAWYSDVFGITPYFDEPFYVGFNIGGYELGLDPDTDTRPGPGGATAYWGVADLDAVLAHVA